MKVIIQRRRYDTDTAKQLAFKHVGEFGDAAGYEERLYLTNRGLYFIYGVGGADSPYPEEKIKPITKEEADAWEAANKPAAGEVVEKKGGKAKKSAKAAEPKVKKPRKPAAKKAAKVVEPAADAGVSEDEET